jgi:F-type H+-transporting ATPase subunit alpha
VSVSRVGGAAQIRAMRKVAGSLRLDLSQYRELEAFAAFASDLDPTSRAQLDRGARLVEVLKQGQYSPLSAAEQVVAIYAGTQGHLDSVPVGDVRRFEAELLDYVRHHAQGVISEIQESGELSDDAEKRLVDAINEVKQQFTASDGSSVVNEAAADALDPDAEGRESVKVRRPAPKK